MNRRSHRTRTRRPRALSPVLTVLCEGKKTEYEYLTRLGQSAKERGAAMRILRGTGGDAVGLVERAVRQRDTDRRNQKFFWQDGDKVYAIFDVEPHDPSRADSLDAALRLAEHERVGVLLSNPSFEFWLLCHVAEAGDLCRAFNDPKSTDRELQKQFGHGKDDLHSDPGLFDRLVPYASRAVEVARHVHENHHGNADDIRGCNACTTVYKLVGYLIGAQSDPP